MAKNLEKFDAEHHETLKVSFAGKMGWWKEETEDKKQRCKVCWVRSYDCFCKTIERKRNELEEIHHQESSVVGYPNFKVLMYYHYMEIGRSANTAHVFEALCPTLTDPLIFGDVQNENKLIEDIHQEYLNNEPVTCLMYPSSDAMLLSDWMDSRPNKSAPIRLVALDGTYPMARRQVKYLNSRCQLLNCKIPLVKLDLKNGACKSAIAGIMSQPGKDKICTFQALVMAMRQINISSAYCDHLSADLEDWLVHILKTKIKFGKTQIVNPPPDVDDKPEEFVMAVLRKQPPPTAENFISKAMKQSLSGHLERKGRDKTTEVEANEGAVMTEYTPIWIVEFTSPTILYDIKPTAEPRLLLYKTPKFRVFDT